MSSNNHCFCNLCKGKHVLTKYKVRQHERAYGLWKLNEEFEESDGPSNAKKSRLPCDNESNSSDTSDEEQPSFDLEVIESGNDTIPFASDHDETTASSEVLGLRFNFERYTF